MSERKVLNKYIDPNFNEKKLVKVPKAAARQHNVRMMLPFSIKCDTCGNYLRIGTKINMRKETVQNEFYLSIPIYRFYMKCVFCYSEMTMKTDPKNHDYVMEIGAVRLYESWKDARAAEELLSEIRKNEEEGNTMTFLEHKTYDSKREMDILEAIDEIRVMSKKNARIDTDTILEALQKRDYKLSDKELREYVDKMSEIEQMRAVKRVADSSQLEDFTRNLIDSVSSNRNKLLNGRQRQPPELKDEQSKVLGKRQEIDEINLDDHSDFIGSSKNEKDHSGILNKDVKESTTSEELAKIPHYKTSNDETKSTENCQNEGDKGSAPLVNSYQLVEYSEDEEE